ncbi:MAG: anaerobic sulfite reductase subunit AsrB [Spirochaetaceae bacterium]|jgi:anaerobic sulfite reductase subunit B|nr:anaerobic sulfite reductase subunit AsrB [Spirochaetaceae bacterium]
MSHKECESTLESNDYLPFPSEIVELVKHTDTEYTFRMSYTGNVKPGQFFEISIPKVGEAPISVSGIGEGTVDLTIRKAGTVTGHIFECRPGDALFMRGPYGNGFDIEDYRHRELFIIAGGTGFSPVRGVADYFFRHPGETKGLTIAAGFKTPKDILFRDDFIRWKTRGRVVVTVDSAAGDTAYPVGLVTGYIPVLEIEDPKEAAAIVVGPPAMMRFSVAGLLDKGFPESHIWVSYERKMCCGIGKCGHCRINDSYVCVDGPVFLLSRAKALLD